MEGLIPRKGGVYNTICGVGITAGNLLTGATLDAARANGMPGLPWLTLVLLGGLSAAMLATLHHTGRLDPNRQIALATHAR